MEMVDRGDTLIYGGFFLGATPTIFTWNGKDFKITDESTDTKSPIKRDRMIYWGVDASEIMLGRNGEVFFRSDE